MLGVVASGRGGRFLRPNHAPATPTTTTTPAEDPPQPKKPRKHVSFALTKRQTEEKGHTEPASDVRHETIKKVIYSVALPLRYGDLGGEMIYHGARISYWSLSFSYLPPGNTNNWKL